jgi:peptide/nickel transport system permease protein
MMTIIARMTRSTMIGELESSYAQTAKAKGLSGARIVLRHCLRGTMVPVVTVLGMQVGAMLMGTVLLENVFGLGGLGSLLLAGLQSNDYPVIQGCVLLIVVVFMGINLVIDILYALIDPRVRLTQRQ